MKKTLIAAVLVILCVSMGIFFYYVSSQGKKDEKQEEDPAQIDPGSEEIQARVEPDEGVPDVSNGGNNIADKRTKGDGTLEFQTVREDWLKNLTGDADIDDALKHVKEIDFRKITRKDVENAIQCGDLETLKKIRKSGYSKWNNRNFVLKAANTPFADIMRFLAENGADLDVTDNEGFSALYLAAIEGNVETAKILAGWLGNLGDVPVKQFPYLKDAVEVLSLAAARNMIIGALKRKMEEGEDLRSEKTGKDLFLELSKYITMERKSPPPEKYEEIKKTALDELGFRKKQSEVTAAAEDRFPLHKLLDQVRVCRQAVNGRPIYISGRLEEITPRYIVVSQQYIHTMDIPEQEQCKFIPEVNNRYRNNFISRIMRDYEKTAEPYLRKRWKKHLRTARMNGYFYDSNKGDFVHASDILEEELQKLLKKKNEDEDQEDY